jgi:hypothetical protein
MPPLVTFESALAFASAASSWVTRAVALAAACSAWVTAEDGVPLGSEIETEEAKPNVALTWICDESERSAMTAVEVGYELSVDPDGGFPEPANGSVTISTTPAAINKVTRPATTRMRRDPNRANAPAPLFIGLDDALTLMGLNSFQVGDTCNGLIAPRRVATNSRLPVSAKTDANTPTT